MRDDNDKPLKLPFWTETGLERANDLLRWMKSLAFDMVLGPNWLPFARAGRDYTGQVVFRGIPYSGLDDKMACKLMHWKEYSLCSLREFFIMRAGGKEPWEEPKLLDPMTSMAVQGIVETAGMKLSKTLEEYDKVTESYIEADIKFLRDSEAALVEADEAGKKLGIRIRGFLDANLSNEALRAMNIVMKNRRKLPDDHL